jgi:hypothetical protein
MDIKSPLTTTSPTHHNIYRAQFRSRRRLRRKSSILESTVTARTMRLQMMRLSVNRPCATERKSLILNGLYVRTKRKKNTGTTVKNITWDGIL